MQKKSIFETLMSLTYDFEGLAKTAYLWLVKNKSLLDVPQEKYVSIVKAINPMVKTPIAEMFTNIKDSGDLNNIFFISTIMNRKTSLPEMLTITDVAVYGKHLSGIKDKELKKAWVTLSPYLAPPKQSRYEAIAVSGSEEIMASVVRSMLCMAYADNKSWASPKIMAFLAEFYGWMMTYSIDRRYKLDIQDGVVVRYAFAYYYASKMSNDVDDNGAPVLLHKLDKTFFRGMSTSLDTMGSNMAAITQGEPVTIEHVVTFIQSFGPSRLSELNAGLLYRLQSVASHSSMGSMIAVDYPPYLAYLILITQSGSKHPIVNYVLNNMFKAPRIRAIMNDMIKYKRFYTGVNPNG